MVNKVRRALSLAKISLTSRSRVNRCRQAILSISWSLAEVRSTSSSCGQVSHRFLFRSIRACMCSCARQGRSPCCCPGEGCGDSGGLVLSILHRSQVAQIMLLQSGPGGGCRLTPNMTKVLLNWNLKSELEARGMKMKSVVFNKCEPSLLLRLDVVFTLLR